MDFDVKKGKGIRFILDLSLFHQKKKIHLKSNVLFSVKYKNFTTVAERGVIIRDFPNSHYRHKLFFFVLAVIH